MRGKLRIKNVIEGDEINAHIESFNPQITHYRRERAPNRLYLPSDINMVLMHNDFKEKHPQINVSYNIK